MKSAAPATKSRPTDTRRMSVSLPASLQRDFDRMLKERGFENRSQAVAELITAEIAEHCSEDGEAVMAGTLTLFYDESKRNIQQDIATLQRKHLAEVVSSQHVMLEKNHRMEILVVQGPVKTLRKLVNGLLSLRGVKTGSLTLTPMLLPPLHLGINKDNTSESSK